MHYRYLVDAQGVRWRVWDVRPSRIDRRHHIRRLKMIKMRHPERRFLPTRRLDMRMSSLYFPPSESGWLCFESDRGRVRVKQFPPHWPVLSDAELEALVHTSLSESAEG